MPACIDLRKAHRTRQHGDLLAIYTWIDGERSLVLIPHLRKGAPWYVIKESAAFKYDDPAYAARQCRVACDVLGIEPTRANWVRIGTIINEGYPDLYRMPSEPDWQDRGASYGELVVKADGREIAREALAVENKGAEYVPA